MMDVLFWLAMEFCLCAILAAYHGILICNRMIAIEKRIRMFERLGEMFKADWREEARERMKSEIEA